MNRPRSILVATDFGDASNAAKGHAVVMAQALGATLHVLHVIPDPLAMGWGVDAAHLPHLLERTERDVRSRFAELLTDEEKAGIDTTFAVEVGSPAARILDYAAQRGIDLIVMGTNGRGAIERLWVGSVTEHVLRQADCPVLLVKRQRET